VSCSEKFFYSFSLIFFFGDIKGIFFSAKRGNRGRDSPSCALKIKGEKKKEAGDAPEARAGGSPLLIFFCPFLALCSKMRACAGPAAGHPVDLIFSHFIFAFSRSL